MKIIYSLVVGFLCFNISDAVECKVNEKGAYHNSEYWNGTSTTLSTADNIEMTTVNYFYEMEYDPAIVKDDTEFEDMQITFEKYISEQVLSETDLFQNCYLGSPSTSTRSLASDPNINVIPVSLFYAPIDKVTDLKCSKQTSKGSICKVLEGVLTIFYIAEVSSSTNMVDYKSSIKNLIDDGMNGDGNFESAHDALIYLKYMDWGEYHDLKKANKITSNSSTLGFGTIVFASAGTFAILLLGGITYKYSKRSSSSQPSGLQGHGSSVV